MEEQLSLRSAIFDPFAVPKWLPWVYMHEVLDGICLIPACVTSKMMCGLVFGNIFYNVRIYMSNSNMFVVSEVCAMHLHWSHDLVIVAISNMILTMKEMWNGLEGLEVFFTQKPHTFS